MSFPFVSVLSRRHTRCNFNALCVPLALSFLANRKCTPSASLNFFSRRLLIFRLNLSLPQPSLLFVPAAYAYEDVVVICAAAALGGFTTVDTALVAKVRVEAGTSVTHTCDRASTGRA
jgi:hypothetical protein